MARNPGLDTHARDTLGSFNALRESYEFNTSFVNTSTHFFNIPC